MFTVSCLYVSALHCCKPSPVLGAATYDSAIQLFDCSTYYRVIITYNTYLLISGCTLIIIHTGSGSNMGTGSYRMSVQSFPTAQFLGVSFALGILSLP